MILGGCVCSPFLRRRAPFRALKRLIGLLERAVNQAPGGFKGFGRCEPDSYQAHRKSKPAEFSGFRALF